MASNLHYTVSDICQLISDLRGESTLNTDASRIRFVSKADQDFSRRKFWNFYLLADQSMAGNGTGIYTIGDATHPMRPKGLTDFRVGGTSESYRYSIVNMQTYRDRVSSSSTAYVCHEWFDAANDVWKVTVNASPAASETIYYSYYWTPPTHTASSDVVISPNPYIQAKLALAEIYFAEGEYDLADGLRNEVEQLIADEMGVDNAPAVNQLIAMPIYGASGIGSY